MSEETEMAPTPRSVEATSPFGATHRQFDSSPVDFALSYAKRGLVVLPLRRASNVPHQMLGSGWTRETVGSLDPNQIREWWRIDPAANIGVVTGPRSRVLVLDLDLRPGKGLDGSAALNDLPPLPDGARVHTPSGGQHLWFRWPDDQAPLPNVVSWLPGVDAPWQVAVPPSCRVVTVSDRQTKSQAQIYVEYEWANQLDQLPVAPDWLFQHIRDHGGRSTSGSYSEDLERLPTTEWFIENGLRLGQRNSDCHRLACRLWRNHWPHAELVVSVMHDVWQATSQSSGEFTWAEAMGCIRSAERSIVPQVKAERAWIERLV